MLWQSTVGDKLVIREQTLDQKNFIVTNLRTNSQGKVPSQLIKFRELGFSCVVSANLVHRSCVLVIMKW